MNAGVKILDSEIRKSRLNRRLFYQNFCLATCPGISTKAGMPPIQRGNDMGNKWGVAILGND